MAGQPAGHREQPSAGGAGAAGDGVGQADQFGPAVQVVGDRGDYGPGGVGVELAGWCVRERLVDEVADLELDVRVIAMLGLNDGEWFGAVGERRVVAPAWEQLRLGAEEPDAPGRSAAPR